MEGAGGAAHRRWDTSSQYSFRTSVSSHGEVEEASPPPVERVFVAVPEDIRHGKSTMLWAVENLAKDGAGVVIAHVHCPAQMIPMMGAKVHYSTVNPQRVNDHRKKVRAEAEEKLDEYVVMCRRLKVSYEKLIIDKDDIAKGLEELIALHGITKLVMGAAADKHYSKEMKTLKSKTALRLMEAAASSCKIWFTCKGHLICTREAYTTVPAVPLSPAHTVASTSSASSPSTHTRSMTIHHSESEASSSNGSPRHDLGRSRTEVAQYLSQGATSTPSRLYEPFELNINGKSTVTPRSSIDSWDELGRRSRSSWYDPSRNDDAATISGSATRHQMGEPDDENFSTPSRELVNPGVDADLYDRLLSEAELSKKEAYEESIKRRRAERDMISSLQKANEMENLYQNEIRQRKTIEGTIVRQAQEIEEMKRQHDAMSNELHDVKKQKFVLEQQITEMASAIKDHEEKMVANKYLLQVLQTDKEKLQQERDAAVTEAEGLRRKNDQRISMPLSALALSTEFSSYELEQATQGFNEALKIGEGGFGSVYKGFLRNTTVAIKLLHPQSMQGQSEFNQEVVVLSRVRHPNLVTLIGACREAFGLVYEFLPNGSLEDRLACANNTPPLTWQVRTKIICEMCSALIFLHSNKPHPVVHGDLKPGNILLDANFVSKLGDFGICRLLNQSNTTRSDITRSITTKLHRTTTPKGTFAYMDPELLSTHELTPRSDVYSLGIIILRLLTGRPPQRIAEVVEDAMERGELDAVLDPTAGDWPFVQANQLAHIALRCAEMSRRRRPDLAGEVWKVVEPLMKAASLTAARPSFAASSSDDAHAPSYFVCPIFQEVMTDPHIAEDGFTYEAEAIKGWLDSGHDTSPMTNLKLAHSKLTPNRALRSAILEWQQQLQLLSR
ncbi:U-box domain-containing protein 33-like [Phragmites australis]|uniref:U-box domain-containing protein 33-like n=1 Tax=Phragmites australis TaxID=29695 RepID=UPI002D79C0C8|nr:U-box domain-containing protein 33-like [Phragmites australis]